MTMRRGLLSLVSGNILGKLVGIVRELILATLFGTGAPVSAFRIASTGTLVPINLATADALSVGFLPVHSRLLQESPRDAAVYYRTVSRIVLALGIILLILIACLRDVWASLIAPGSPPATLSLAGSMLAVMALSIPFYIQANLASYLETSHGKFVLASARPTVQSLGLIGGTISAYVLGAPVMLAVGFTSAYIFMSLWGAVRIRRAGYVRVPEPPTRSESLEAARRFWTTVRPVLWVPVISQSVWIAERAIASLTSDDAVAALDYARLITETVQVLISAPLGLVMLSTFASFDAAEARLRLRQTGDVLLLLTVPFSCMLAVGGRFLVEVVYLRGAFDEEAATVTAAIFIGLAVGLWAQALSYTHVKYLNSRGRNREAALALAIGSALWILSQFVLTRELGPLGLGLGASIGFVAQLIITSLMSRQLVAVARRLLSLSPMAGVAVLLVGITEHQLLRLGLLAGFSMVYVVGVRGLRADLLRVFRRGADL